MTDGKQQGVRHGSKFRGLRPVGRRVFFYLRYDVLVCVAASRLPSFFWFLGFGPGSILTIASPDTSFCQSQPGQMPVRSEHADTYLQRRARSVAAVRLWWMWRRWLTERRSGEQLVCAHTSSHDVTEHYRLPEKSSESESSV